MPVSRQKPISPFQKAQQQERRLYYVTVRDADRYGFLLGPYDTHDEALKNVDKGRDLALTMDLKAWFYSYGTSSLLASENQPKPVFGDGKLNLNTPQPQRLR